MPPRRGFTFSGLRHYLPYFLMMLGAALSLFICRDLASPGTSFSAFALFIGVAMSITAFPVLARILEDRNLTHTTLGSIALTCAALDDVTAWCILALVVTTFMTGPLLSFVRK